MRRRAFVEPTSRLAVWSLRFVVLGLAVAVVAVLAARSDWLDGGQAVVALGAGLGIVALGVASALIAGTAIWFSGYRGGRYAAFAVVLGAALLAYPAVLGVIGLRQPAINDITTDPENPPAFDIVASARPPGANPSAYQPALAAQQRELYPEIRPLDVDLAPDEVNELLSDLVDGQKWRVLDQVDYRGAARDGRIEMVTRSLIMGFRDDIVIRVRTVNGRARIDMRSAARYGRQDFGVNARRVVAALDEMRAAARRVQR
ncbi:DUF1499 domain-containing protein [Phreatobacter stygius]|uniref:DUF1499 domain-containing protein n=1 Tax=Phreatobacter stygius TaxID=1940610 RepID=A0A4D7B0H3_9HYPH|nr:DUF1499 domain-containing protein [Phreatobacter stygius]QCI66221.1 DUF1499 domain-containing protein [Phreatobacter stygius]